MDFEQHIYGMGEEDVAIVYILRATNGAELRLCNYGASIISLKIPSSQGVMVDVITPQGSFEEMLKDRNFIGRTIDWSVGLRSSGLHNTMWESRFETNRVVMSQEVDGREIEAIFDFDEDMSLEVTYLAKGEEAEEIDIAPNLLFDLSDSELKINNSEFCPAEELTPTRGEEEFSKDGYERGLLTPVAKLRNSQFQISLLTSKDGVTLCRDSKLGTVSLTPRMLNDEATEIYCQKMVYKFSMK